MIDRVNDIEIERHSLIVLSFPSLFKRGKIPSPPQHEELVAVNDKSTQSNDRAAGATSFNKKRHVSETSPRSAKRHKIHSQSPNKKNSAVIKKREDTTHRSAGENSETVSKYNKKRRVSETSLQSAKRRKIHPQSPDEQTAAINKKREDTTHRSSGENSETVSKYIKKRRVSESSPYFAKRRKIHSQSPNEQTAAIIKKREDTTHGTTDDTSVTTSSYNKKRSASQFSLHSAKRRKIPQMASFSKASQSSCLDQTRKAKEAKRRRAKPTKLSGKEKETARLLRHQGIPLLKTSDVKDIASLGTKLLGSGTYGSCHLAVDPNTRQQLVIKKFPRHSLDDLATEATNLHELRLPGVQRLIGVCVPTRQMVTGFAGTTLSKYFLTQPSFADAISVFLQISTTLQQMINKGFSHNDIKGDNICVQVDSNAPKATIIDLGLARPVGTHKLYDYTSDPDSFPWLAPELLLHTHPCSEASDVYSVAQLLMEQLHPGNIRGHLMPPLGALDTWIVCALKVNPRRRPRLAELTCLLRRLHQEATRDTKV